MIFKYGNVKIEIPQGYEFVYYATFIVGEYDHIHVKKDDIVLDAGAFVGDFTLKIARKVKEVVAVEPLPWAFELLKKNVEANELKNVILINKALYDEDTTLTLSDEGVGSKLGEGNLTVNTITIDELGRNFTVVKMDIEGAEGKVMKGEWINSVREIAIELHGKENIERVTSYLVSHGFKLTEMKMNHLLINTFKNVLLHFPSFVDAERKSKVLYSAIFKKKYYVPALQREEIKIVYGRK
ncbi:hypothetical protein SJAV_01340 [Sulfurisphaera javensis]|uniref:Methyltransferase FkbM domain-containing protein n=1 Tax=Sulfurisphaera javensis TaxID=2049879 RepID=A0AAT9GN18_9CREN